MTKIILIHIDTVSLKIKTLFIKKTRSGKRGKNQWGHGIFSQILYSQFGSWEAFSILSFQTVWCTSLGIKWHKVLVVTCISVLLEPIWVKGLDKRISMFGRQPVKGKNIWSQPNDERHIVIFSKELWKGLWSLRGEWTPTYIMEMKILNRFSNYCNFINVV